MHLRDLLPKTPRFHDRWWMDLHLPTLVLFYSIWIIGLVTVGRSVVQHGFVIQMFANIDNYVLIGLAIAIPVIWAIVMSFSRYINNKKDIMVAQKKAKIDGVETVDTVNAELASKYFIGYALIGILGAALVGIIALFIGDILIGRGTIAGDEEIAGAVIGIAVGLEIVADVYVVNKIGDLAFFIGKEKKAIETFLAPAPSEEVTAEAEVEEDPVQKIAELLAVAMAKKK